MVPVDQDGPGASAPNNSAGFERLPEVIRRLHPFHGTRTGRCFWCSKDLDDAYGTIDPRAWVLHVVTEHLRDDLLDRMAIDLGDGSGVTVRLHEHTLLETVLIADALDLGCTQVRQLGVSRPFVVVSFGHEPFEGGVTLLWYTTPEVVNEALTTNRPD